MLVHAFHERVIVDFAETLGKGDLLLDLLSMARLNIAKSRVRPSTWSLVRIDQTCFGRSGGFAPISLPLFQGECLAAGGLGFARSCMSELGDAS
jgi:hypothetical protein